MKAKFVVTVDFDNDDYADGETEELLQGDELKAALTERFVDGDIEFAGSNIESVEVSE